MTNGNGAPPEAAPAEAAPPPQLNVLAQYTKDLSFENPNAPTSLAPQQQPPAINIQINVSANNIAEHEYEVTLSVEGKAENGGKLTMFDMTVPEQAKVPAAHYHRDFEEVWYGLGGTLTVTVDGVAHRLKSGDALFVPRGAVHRFDNLDAGDARALVTLTPAVAGKRYFEDIAAVVNAGGPPDMAKVKAVMDKYGLIAA